MLDGLEVIQHSKDPNSPHYSQIKESHQQVAQLLRHICNQQQSRLLITSRLLLQELSGASGYRELELKTLNDIDGAQYLRRLGVSGNEQELQRCATLFGGHPLTLKAAGHYMARRRITAERVEELVGDEEVFRRSSEGERVKKIVDAYREELNEAQQHFLKMLSIHPRSVEQHHLNALLLPGMSEAMTDEREITEQIILPLEQRFLIEVLDEAGERHYSAHPLMKLAFATWLNAEGSQRTHRDWAQAAQASPALAGSPMQANSLDALQPWLDVLEHYLEAEDYQAAWGIYRDRGVDRRLNHLGYANKLLQLGRCFEQRVDLGQWDVPVNRKQFLYEYLGHACNTLQSAREDLEYREKQFLAAQQSGGEETIVANGAILAESLCNLGHLRRARQQLKQIEATAEGLREHHAKSVYQNTQAKIALFSGNYAEAIELYPAALKHAVTTNHILGSYYLGEAQCREGALAAAANTMHQAKNEAEKEQFNTLLSAILLRLSWLALKQNDIATARSYSDERMALEKSLGLPTEDSGLLLVREGRYQQALNLAANDISQPGDDKLDKNSEIIALLITAQAHHGLKQTDQAKTALEQARTLMQKTGCWRVKDWLEETEQLLT